MPEDLYGMIPGKRNFFVSNGKTEPELTEERKAPSVLNQTVQDSEQKRIEECLRNNCGNRGKTAAELNISTATLWRKIKKYHIDLY